MVKLTDPEIIDLINAIKRGEVDMTQGYRTLVQQDIWLEARFMSDPDYKENFPQFWKELKAHYAKKKAAKKNK